MEATPSLALRIAGLQRRFPVGWGLRRRTVLDGLDLEVAAGTVLGLVGPNGSGKSTLLRLAAGVDRPDAGRVEVFGQCVSDARTRARLAYLPEDSPFPPELSALAVLDLSAALSGRPRHALRARGRSLLARVGLTEFERRPLATYSRGMLRRFGLAQVFLTEAELVLLDEPTAGLDALGFEVVHDLLGEARSQGTTVVLSSHLLGDVHDHCDQLAVLAAGRVAAHGTPEELCAIDGRVALEVEGLAPDALEDLGEWIRGHGGRVRSTRPTGRGLLELYRGGNVEA